MYRFCPNIVQITICHMLFCHDPCHTFTSIMHEVVDKSLCKICHYQQNVPQPYHLLDTLVSRELGNMNPSPPSPILKKKTYGRPSLDLSRDGREGEVRPRSTCKFENKMAAHYGHGRRKGILNCGVFG